MTEQAGNISRFEFFVSDLESELRVVRFIGKEEISRPFQFQLELASEDDEIDFDSVVDMPATLVLYGKEENRYVNGIVSRFAQGEQGTRFTTYHATLVPKIWRLGHRHNCRIFQEKTVPEIIKQILDELGLVGDEYRQSLQGEYRTREYCVQYRESELNFISRLMEEEGIFYLFEHHEDKHVMVMGDRSAAHPGIAGSGNIIFHGPATGQVSGEHIFYFSYREEVRPGVATLRDYNFKKPTLNLEGQAQAQQDTLLEVYDHPGEYEEPAEGKDLAKIRLEGQRVLRKIGKGQSNCTPFIAGATFTLEEYSRESFNQKYLLIGVEITGAQPQVLEETAGAGGTEFSNRFRCIPFDIPYRPARITRRPFVQGSQSAIVVGPSGEEIYTDEHGRIKVQFHWDREGQSDEKSSCWIRVSQSWAGAGWGAIYLPRIGQEVIVDFFEGDPDCPIITGRVYHGLNRPPYPLPDEKTKSTLKSNSSKGGEGFNEIRLEDKKGEEQIFIHAERNKDLRVKLNSMEWIGNNRHLLVKKDQIEKVEENKHLTVVQDLIEKIEEDTHLTIVGDRMQSIQGDQHMSITGDRKESVTGDDNLTVTGNSNLESGKTISAKADMDIHEKAGMNYAMEGGMDVHIKGGMNVTVEAGISLTLKVGGNYVNINPGGVFITGTVVMINSGGSAGSGPGCSPNAPAAPSAPDEPEEPVAADNAQAGKVAKPKEKQKPHKTEKYGPQAMVLKRASQSGTPLYEKDCDCKNKKK